MKASALASTLSTCTALVGLAASAVGQAYVPHAQAAAQPQMVQPGMQAAGPMAQSEYPLLMVDPDHKLQQGDQLSFSIEEDREPAVPLVVGASGDVRIEPLCQVHVVGLTVPEATAAIRRKLEQDYYYTATVRLGLERVSAAATLGFVYLSGEINRVGSVPVSANRPLHLSEAVLEAGGIGRFGNAKKVRVTRTSKSGQIESFIKDVDSILKGKNVDQDLLLQDGDKINVPRSALVF